MFRPINVGNIKTVSNNTIHFDNWKKSNFGEVVEYRLVLTLFYSNPIVYWHVHADVE